MRKTKTLIYLKTPINRFASFQFGEYEFTFDKDMKPIPVQVPDEVAQILLQMKKHRPACCKRDEPKPLFKEVQ